MRRKNERYTDDAGRIVKDIKSYFVSESSVHRLLNARNLITSPAYITIKATNELKEKTCLQ